MVAEPERQSENGGDRSHYGVKGTDGESAVEIGDAGGAVAELPAGAGAHLRQIGRIIVAARLGRPDELTPLGGGAPGGEAGKGGGEDEAQDEQGDGAALTAQVDRVRRIAMRGSGGGGLWYVRSRHRVG